MSQEAINAAVDRRLAEIEAQKKAEEAQKKQCADQQGYVVGSDLQPHGQLQRRPVPLAGNAEQGLHHAHRRLDADGQCLVEPDRCHEGSSRAPTPATSAGSRFRRHLGRHRQTTTTATRTAPTSAASAPLSKAPSGKPASTDSFWPWKTISTTRSGSMNSGLASKTFP